MSKPPVSYFITSQVVAEETYCHQSRNFSLIPLNNLLLHSYIRVIQRLQLTSSYD